MSEMHVLLGSLVDSGDDLLEQQAMKIARYINESERGIITKELCRSYIQDVRDKMQLDIIFDKITDIETAQWAVDELTQLLIRGI